MPVYLDFMFVFGAQSDTTDLRFNGFCKQTTMKPSSPTSPAMSELGRSGRHFTLCYNLKGVTLKKKSGANTKNHEWSIRQAAIYHQFDVEYGTSLWIITKGHPDILKRYKELTGSRGRPENVAFDEVDQCFRSSLAAHLLYCHWSTEDWGWYIRWLEEVTDAEVNFWADYVFTEDKDQQNAIAVSGPPGPGHARKVSKLSSILALQPWSDKIKESIMIIDANLEIIMALRKFYRDLRKQRHFPPELAKSCADDIADFTAHLDQITADFKKHASRARLLVDAISDSKKLIIQHLQGQATERTEQLNINLEKEAIVMRIVTLVTLFFLPATFVSVSPSAVRDSFLAATNTRVDFLQHRHSQISERGWRTTQ
jgi:hypothetical protein